ncbi:carbon-nitrogen hydrolase family protein [Seleniivibrio sp.]|uniref:carbon-nitrogen hydrolase family protein n=1 Tax=Seleniivibrio sp. TaxID=2898801 RepID=UPI0025F39ECE|nr:carbon-nitrogen hydrolase family protein [Seleniivibrio sp.]MCD8554877.1 carbon-nitrogen hydrolase family protein [Seleniivibrio sp.]
MKLAIFQIKHGQNKKENLDKILSAINLHGKDCDLILFPETCMGIKTDSVSLSDMAEDIHNGEFISAVRAACAEAQVHACVCLWEKATAEKVYNTAVVVAPDGSTKAVYRKLHLFDALSVKESDDMTAGSELPPTFEVCGVKCSLGICYDLRFPEVFRGAALGGVQLFLIPAAWYAGEHKLNHLKTLLAARALENTAYFACADICGGSFSGHSAVYSPFGLCEAEAGADECVIYADIDTDKVSSVRKILPCLENISAIFKEL